LTWIDISFNICEKSRDTLCCHATILSGKEPEAGFKRNARNIREGIYGGGKGLWSEEQEAGVLFGYAGSAGRFFYCAKADRAERGEGNTHPTVKPLDLMRYLVRLVCPAGGIVLDPFAGSGTTGLAARMEHARAVLIEDQQPFCEIIKTRLGAAANLLPLSG